MSPRLEETIYFDFITSSAAGAAADADSTPTAEVFEDATDTAILSPTVVKRTSKTGNYRIPVACTTANGFEEGKTYNVVASATVGAVAAKAVVGTFQIRNAYVLPADGSIGPSTPTSDFAPQIGGDILNLAAGDLINTNPNGVGNLIIATKTAVDALTTAVAAIPTTSGSGGTSGGNGFF